MTFCQNMSKLKRKLTIYIHKWLNLETNSRKIFVAPCAEKTITRPERNHSVEPVSSDPDPTESMEMTSSVLILCS